MKKVIIIVSSLLVTLSLVGGILFFNYTKVHINNVSVSEDINDDYTKKVTISIHNPLKKTIYCAISESEELSWVKAKDNKCEINVKSGSYKVYIKDSKGVIENSALNGVEVNKVIDLSVNTDKIYLTMGESYTIEAEATSIGKIDDSVKYESENSEIVTVSEEGVVSPVGEGEATIKVKSGDITKEVNVVVTSLYRKADLSNNNEFLPCERYTEEEAHILDEVLEFKIKEVGYQTRAAAVAAARFLVLEFPYRISYFYETGRLNNYDVIDYVDGEGRYYKKGLYLSKDKYDTILSSKEGPAIWGCPLKNLNDDPPQYIPGVKYPNGLDCSGFISWVLFNAGFDVGDNGAGDTPRNDDMNDLGEKIYFDRDFIYNGHYTVGDLIGWDSHIAIIAGITDTSLFIAESLPGGVVIKEFYKNGSNNLYKYYEFVNVMDSVYKEDGKLTNMW